MSTNDGTVKATRVAHSPQEKLLQIMLLSMTVPFREGGGLVFPIGFPRGGYRLDEWQFERYCASLDQRLRSHLATWRAGRIRFATLLLLAFALVAAVAFNFFSSQGHLDEALRPWLQVLLVLPAVPTLLSIFVFNYRSREDFARSFPDAPSIPRTAHLSRRMLGYVAARSIRPVPEAILVLIFAVAGSWLIRIALRENFFALHLFAAALLLMALFKAWQLLVYWQFHRRHRRAPMIADFSPVDSPDSPPSSSSA